MSTLPRFSNLGLNGSRKQSYLCLFGLFVLLLNVANLALYKNLMENRVSWMFCNQYIRFNQPTHLVWWVTLSSHYLEHGLWNQRELGSCPNCHFFVSLRFLTKSFTSKPQFLEIFTVDSSHTYLTESLLRLTLNSAYTFFSIK